MAHHREKFEIEIIDFDLRAAVEDVLDLLGTKAQEKGLELVGLMYAAVPTTVKGDPSRIRQVLMNLVGNAIKFTDTGEVVVQVVPEMETPEEVLIRVDITDTGIGIEAEGRQQLFQSFSQADGSMARKYGGTGLGLAISKELVELMGGTIGVDSKVGHGSRFWFTVRLQKQEQPSVQPEAQIKSLEGLRVCVVHDNEANRLLLHHHLIEWGMLCTSMGNGETVVAWLKQMVGQGEPCDFLVVDRHIHGVDGFTLAREVKADPILSEIRIIMLTTLAQRGDATAAREAGIVGYLTKPIHQDQLRECLLVVVNGSEMAEPQLVTKHILREGWWRKGMKLLVTEDNIVNQKVAVRMLERLGYRIDVVADGKEAVEAVARIPYDAVLMDCQMPEMDGYEATQEIRRREASLGNDEIQNAKYKRRLPIIAMTANAMKGDREKCLSVGMDDFLSKPVKPEELETVLDRWVPKRETETRAASVGDHKIRDTSYEQPGTSNQGLVPSDGPQDPPLDVATLDGLKELSGDDPSFLIEVIQQFLQDGPVHVTAIRHAVVEGDADTLMKAAHGFKGSCRNMGALPLGELCCTLEEKGRVGEAYLLENVLREIEHEYSRVQTALEAELAGLPAGSEL